MIYQFTLRGPVVRLDALFRGIAGGQRVPLRAANDPKSAA